MLHNLQGPFRDFDRDPVIWYEANIIRPLSAPTSTALNLSSLPHLRWAGISIPGLYRYTCVQTLLAGYHVH
jgi:hypothetical protein